MDIKVSIEEGFERCETLARTHYENFPVASILLPKALRRPISVIYAFAREADDIADEGNDPEAVRLAKLDHFWSELETIQAGNSPATPLFLAVREVCQKYQLPINLLFDLLRAFKQDVVKRRYETFDEILSYCRFSANPVGRLLLHLTKQASIENGEDSDAICTALQLINFIQDLRSDLEVRDRCYFAKEELSNYKIQIRDLKLGLRDPKKVINEERIQAFFAEQINIAESLLKKGQRLGRRIPGMFGFELRMILGGGFRMIKKLKERKSVYVRPTLNLLDWVAVVWYAVRSKMR